MAGDGSQRAWPQEALFPPHRSRAASLSQGKAWLLSVLATGVCKVTLGSSRRLARLLVSRVAGVHAQLRAGLSSVNAGRLDVSLSPSQQLTRLPNNPQERKSFSRALATWDTMFSHINCIFSVWLAELYFVYLFLLLKEVLYLIECATGTEMTRFLGTLMPERVFVPLK